MRGSGRDLIVRGGGNALIELGNQPPLSASGEEPEEDALIRGAISWRWLVGSILTGVTSIVLMGAALTAAFNGPRQFGAVPAASAAVAVASPDSIIFGQKGDRIRPVLQPVATRQVIQVSTVTHQGDHDLIKLLPFAKVSTTLSPPTDAIAKQIPAFDMVNIMGGDPANSDSTATPAANTPAPQTALDQQLDGPRVDGAVSIQVSDFSVTSADLAPATGLSTADVEKVVLAAANLPIKPALSGLNAGPATPDPSALAVRIETENVSDIAKAGTDTSETVTEKVATVAQNGDLGALLQANGIAPADAAKVVTAHNAPRRRPPEIRREGPPRVRPADRRRDIPRPGRHPGAGPATGGAAPATPAAPPPKLIRASVYQDGAHLATVARADNDSFVRADEPSTPLAAIAADALPDPSAATAGGAPTIYNAVYATALQQQIPKPLVDQLIRIFAFDVDLTAKISPGDSMEVFHSLPDPTDTTAGDPEILFASLTLGGVTKRFYRYRTGDDGAVDYYDQQGQSAKKFLLRKPIVGGEISSGFGYRIHPILGTRILHTGVDYAADRLTPIFAAGDGVIEQTGYDANGYGNFIIIKHTNGYETLYGHQTKYATGIAEGVKVHQGQVIGYVGSTGLSTGPHVHFEIRINGTPVDPLRVRLPNGPQAPAAMC